jgi:hypothetical protein
MQPVKEFQWFLSMKYYRVHVWRSLRWDDHTEASHESFGLCSMASWWSEKDTGYSSLNGRGPGVGHALNKPCCEKKSLTGKVFVREI